MDLLSYFTELFSTAGKTALVTGGASGIGRMITTALARSGADVIIASRKLSACEATAAEINAQDFPGRVHALAGDVSSDEGLHALCDRVADMTDHLEVLVNNSGKTWGAPFERFPYDAWGSVFSVNVTAPFVLTQRLLPLLRARASAADPTRVINIGSMVGVQPVAEQAYSNAASKAAVHHLTRLMAAELAGFFITVNAIAPGVFESRMSAYVTEDEARRSAVTDRIPLRRLGAQDDIAGSIHLLCGRGGAYMTGTILAMDGGLGILPPPNLFS